jgi:imidazolonepropionase-like amidohydrolase
VATRIVAELAIPGQGEPIEHAVVVLDGPTISYAGAAGRAPKAASEDVTVEVPVVMPGLWDCHAHFVGMETVDLQRLALTSVVVTTARATADAARTLMGGVTSVRDVGGNGLQLAAAIDEGAIPGPRIHGAGAILSTTGGHADVHSLPLDWVHQIEGVAGLGIICDGVPEVLRAVRMNLRANARLIKICASGGVASEVDHPIHQQFSDEELRAIVGEATRADRLVAAHCHGKPGIMAALRAGVMTIEHGSYLDEEAADLMVETGAILVPTRFVIDQLLENADQLPGYVYEKAIAVADHHEAAMKIAVAKGVKIAAGCDIFVSGDTYGRNGSEIVNLINAGLTDLEAIEAATARAPETLGPQAPRSGRLEVGYDADVITLDANPLDDRSVWGEPDRVTHVWKAGAQAKATDR